MAFYAGDRLTGTGSVGSGITFDSGFSGSGTFSDGQAVTITRAAGSWGAKPNGAKPLWWYPFEANGNPDATYSRTTTTPFTPDGAMSSAIVRTGSTAAWRKDLAADTEPVFTGNPGFGFVSDDLYIAYASYHAWSFATSPAFNLKEVRIWQSPSGGSNACVYHSMEGGSGVDGDPRYSVEQIGGGSSDYGGPPFSGGQWDIDETQYRTSTLNVADGHYDHIRNGIAGFSLATYRKMFRETGKTAKFAEFYLSQKSNPTPLANAFMYLDWLYIDDSWCRVVISDEPSWQTSTYPTGTVRTREPQLITAWSAGGQSISVTLRKGAHTLSGKYLYVVGNGTNDVMVPDRIGQFT